MPSFTVSADSRRLESHGAHFVWLVSVLAVIVLLLTFGVFGAAKSTAAQRAPVRGIYSYDVPVSNTPARRVGDPPPAAPHGSEATRASGQLRATATPLVSVVAGEGAGARGLSDLGGVFSSETNAAGGTVWTSIGAISQNDIAPLVNSGMYGGDVNVLSGVDESLYTADVARFGNLPGVHVYDWTSLTPSEISALVNGPGTTIAGFCDSGVCLAPYR